MFQWFTKGGKKQEDGVIDHSLAIVPDVRPELQSSNNSRLPVPRLVARELEGNDDSECSGTTNESGRTSAHHSQQNSLRTPLASHRLMNHNIDSNQGKLDLRSESQQRIESMNDLELECSPIFDYLFVGGVRVAQNLSILRENRIHRIINCASGIIPNYFPDEFKYLSINLLDGKTEDISWFICQVIQFIVEGVKAQENILIHCEKGISRSTAFAIAYYMWCTGKEWRTAYNFILEKRKISNPNPAFITNLIELNTIFSGSLLDGNLLFRCAYHAAHDHTTAVLKLCRNLVSQRRVLIPATSLLNPKGVFVLRAVKNNIHNIFLWQGKQTSAASVQKSLALAKGLIPVFSNARQPVIIIQQGEETEEFLSYFVRDGPFREPEDGSASYVDYYDYPPSYDQIEKALAVISSQRDTSTAMPLILQQLGVPSNPDLNKSAQGSTRRGRSPPAVVAVPPKEVSNRTDRSRSTSRERIHGTIVSGTTTEEIRTGEGSYLSHRSIGVTSSRPTSFRHSNRHLVVPTVQGIQLKENNTVKENNLSAAEPTKNLGPSVIVASYSPSMAVIPTPSNIPALSLGGVIAQAAAPGSNQSTRRENSSSSNRPSLSFPAIDTVRSRGTSDASVTREERGISNSDLYYPPSSLLKRPSPPSSTHNLRSSLQIQQPIYHPKSGTSTPDRCISRNSSVGLLPVAPPSRPGSGGGDRRPEISPKTMKITNNKGVAGNGVGFTPSRPGSGKLSPLSLSFHNKSTMTSAPVAISSNNEANSNPDDPPLQRRDEFRPYPGSDSRPAQVPTNTAIFPSTETVLTFTKPKLYQLVKSESCTPIHCEGGSSYEWRAMGLYEDDDLDSNEILLLLCPDGRHHVWIGQDFPFQDAGMEVDLDGRLILSRFAKWLVKVQVGEVFDASLVGQQLSSVEVLIHLSGEESDEFFQAFEEGM